MTEGDGTTVRARLRAALTQAMRERDRAAVSALRSTLGAIDNAEAVAVEIDPAAFPADGVIAGAVSGLGAADVPRRELTDDDQVAIVRAEVDERRAAAAGYERAGEVDRAATLHAEADALDAVLDGALDAP
jgi:uncharacterized protein